MTPRPSHTTPESSDQPGQPTILVVDDDPRFRYLLHQTLERAGYAVFLAVDAVDAESALLKAAPDLVILDMVLPHTSGAELLRDWRVRGLDVPVVILTAHGNAELQAAILEAGAD